MNFLKVQSISDQNLFTELKNIEIKYFCENFQKYLECHFLHFSYVKSIPKLGKKVCKIQKNSPWKALNRLFSLCFVQWNCLWWYDTNLLEFEKQIWTLWPWVNEKTCFWLWTLFSQFLQFYGFPYGKRNISKTAASIF